MKQWFRVIVLVLLSTQVFAGENSGGGGDSQFTVAPVFDSLGNTARLLNVRQSLNTAVLISSSARNATAYQFSSDTQPLNIDTYRWREIMNLSTCSALSLQFGDRPVYAVGPSSFGVIIDSNTTASANHGGTYVVRHQEAVWGSWFGPATCSNGAGAGGSESYYSESRRK